MVLRLPRLEEHCWVLGRISSGRRLAADNAEKPFGEVPQREVGQQAKAPEQDKVAQERAGQASKPLEVARCNCSSEEVPVARAPAPFPIAELHQAFAVTRCEAKIEVEISISPTQAAVALTGARPTCGV